YELCGRTGCPQPRYVGNRGRGWKGSGAGRQRSRRPSGCGPGTAQGHGPPHGGVYSAPALAPPVSAGRSSPESLGDLCGAVATRADTEDADYRGLLDALPRAGGEPPSKSPRPPDPRSGGPADGRPARGEKPPGNLTPRVRTGAPPGGPRMNPTQ